MKHRSAARLARSLTPTLAVMLALALVVTGPGTPVASAFDVLPSPVTAPGSVLGAGNVSGYPYNKILSNNPKIITTAPTSASGLTKFGMNAQGIAVAGGFMLGTEIGSGIAGAIGLPTSGNFVCDLMTLTINSSCGVSAASGYVPNSDVSEVPPGWFGGLRSVTGIGGKPTSWPNSTITWDVKNTPAFDSAPQGGLVVTATISGQCNNDGWVPPNSTVRLVYRDTFGGGSKETELLGDVFNVGHPACSPTASWTLPNPPASLLGNPRYKFDHIKIFRQNAGTETPVFWYPVGHAKHQGGVEADPVRWFQTNWRCSGGQTGSKKSAEFRESESNWAPFPTAQCDVGTVVYYEVLQVIQGVDGTTKVFDWTAPAAVASWIADVEARGAQQDTLQLSRVYGNERVSCFSDPGLCVDWFTDPAKTQNYECTHGTKVLALAECNVYRPTFNPAQTVQGINYADPVTGALPSPTTPLPAPTPGSSPDSSACFPRGWGAFNPAEWVLKPVSCALTYAFVPSPKTQTRISTLQTTATTVAPIPQIQSLFTWLKPPDSAPTCGSFGIPIWFIDKTLTAVDTCNANDPIMKGLRPLRPVLELAVWVGMFAPLAWWAWREYAPGSKGVA